MNRVDLTNIIQEVPDKRVGDNVICVSDPFVVAVQADKRKIELELEKLKTDYKELMVERNHLWTILSEKYDHDFDEEYVEEN